jgi:hypothetical protein
MDVVITFFSLSVMFGDIQHLHSAYMYMPSAFYMRSSTCAAANREHAEPCMLCAVLGISVAERFWLFTERVGRSAYKFITVVHVSFDDHDEDLAE